MVKNYLVGNTFYLLNHLISCLFQDKIHDGLWIGKTVRMMVKTVFMNDREITIQRFHFLLKTAVYFRRAMQALLHLHTKSV